MAYRFFQREPLQAGVRRIAREQIEEVLEAVRSPQPDARSVHAARKALKKLRALLRLVRKQIGEEVFLRESACCRDAGRLLSSARDADVRLATFDASSKNSAGPIRELLLKDVQSARRSGLNAKKRKALARSLELARDRMQLLELGDNWKVLKQGLRRSFRRVRKSFEAASASDVDSLHLCRKRFKDLHYQLSLLRPAFGPELKKIEAMTKKMGELLGDERDLGLLCENLKSRMASEAVGAVCGKIARRQNQIQQKAVKLGHEIVDAMAEFFPKTMGECWKKWRKTKVPAPRAAAL